MKKINFNRGWEFILENELDAFNAFGFDKYTEATGAPGRFYVNSVWKKIDLPHDWAVALEKDLRANTFAGARPNTRFHRFMTERHSEIEKIYNIGWYRKQFDAPAEWESKRIFLEFEGVFRDAMVWVNGVYLDRHLSGYNSFILEITDHLVLGEQNSVAVRVDSSQQEGWWYEGAGIYRNVFLCVAEPLYIKPNKTIVKAAIDGSMFAECVIVNDTAEECRSQASFEVISPEGECVLTASGAVQVTPFNEARIKARMKVNAPSLWHVDSPNLYRLRISVGRETHEEVFGFRSVSFDAEKGFFLNGKPLKIRGACVHQDFGGVGVALTDNLQYYKIMKLKEMGVNAYRASHHAPSPALLRACDELGMLVMDETRMFGSSPEAIRQLTELIERDRNHPCVFIWSLGNEEFSVQNLAWSKKLMEKMTRIAKALDDTRSVTYGGNNNSDFTGANAASEIRGINYIRSGGKPGDWVDEYHREHPHQPILGTEESSYVLSRGGAKTNLGSGRLDSTGLVTMRWGSTPKGWVKYFETRDYLAGSFMWTGFDYRGEPNPFVTAYTSSSFGTIDLCGMEKPPFYYYKAWWTNETVLKLAPHWNHAEGETAEVSVFTNLSEITLSLNGRKLNTVSVNRFDAPVFHVPFEKGILRVEGMKDGKIYADEMITAGPPSKIMQREILRAKDESEIGIIELVAVDEDGVFCPTAQNAVEIDPTECTLVGVGNGDPACLDYEQKPEEFEEKLIRTFENGDDLYTVPEKDKNRLRRRYDWLQLENKKNGFEDDERRVALFADTRKEEETVTLSAKVTGVSGFEYISFERLGGCADIYVNGEWVGNNYEHDGRIPIKGARPYRFFCSFRDGENEIRVVSRQAEDSGLPVSGSVKIGRRITSPWRVQLHYGLARVFVRGTGEQEPCLKARLIK